MSYRGDDLDLRLPPGRAAGARGSDAEIDQRVDSNGARYRVKAYRHDRTAPLWVDDVVLAVCNAAHEVAQALHSPEVLLQHVVHGMTRVDIASGALEKHGIDITALRQDVTELISSTAARAPSVELPMTSSEFKAALRLAGEGAGRRGGDAITIDDLLDVLMNYDADHPGIALLNSHIRRSGRAHSAPLNDDFGESYRRQTAPQPKQAATGPEPPYAVADQGGAMPPRTEPLYGVADTARHAPPEWPAASDMPKLLGAMEERLSARLAGSESGYRAELHALQAERGDISNLVRQLQTGVASQRSETIHMRDALGEQLRDIQRSAMSHRGDSDAVAPVLSRLQGLERLFEGRLADVSSLWSGLGSQVEAIEAALSHQSHDTSELKETVASEFKLLGDMLDKFKIDVPDLDENLGGRLDTIETMLLERVNEEDADGAACMAEHLTQVTSLLEDHRKQIAASMHERERNWSAVNERLNKLEHIMTSQHESVQTAAADRNRVFSSVNERLAGLEQLVQRQSRGSDGPGSELLVEMNKTLAHVSGAQKTTAEVLDQWRLEMSGDLSVINNRLESVERNSTRPVAMLEALGTNFRNLKTQLAEKPAPQPQPQPQLRSHTPSGFGRAQSGGLWDSFYSWMFGPR